MSPHAIVWIMMENFDIIDGFKGVGQSVRGDLL